MPLPGRREGWFSFVCALFVPRLLNWNLCGLLVFVEHQDSVPIFAITVNHEKDSAEHTVESKAACTTNYLALGTKVVHDKFGIVKGLMATMRAICSNAVDRGPSRGGTRLRTSSTCAASTVREVNLELNGKLTGLVFRVQRPDVSVADLRCRLSKPKPTKMDDFHKAMKTAAAGPMEGISLIRYL